MSQWKDFRRGTPAKLPVVVGQHAGMSLYVLACELTSSNKDMYVCMYVTMYGIKRDAIWGV